MPKLNGDPTRAEKRRANKRALAIADRERDAVGRTIPPDAFEHRPASDRLPYKKVNGYVLRRRRGELTDEACIDRVCALVAHGVTVSTAREHVGVSATQWGDWRLYDKHGLNRKLAFAKQLFNENKADEVFDIIDDPNIMKMPKLDKNGNPTGPSIKDKLSWAEARCRRRESHRDSVTAALRAASAAPPAAISITNNINTGGNPQRAAEDYYAVLEARPNPPSE